MINFDEFDIEELHRQDNIIDYIYDFLHKNDHGVIVIKTCITNPDKMTELYRALTHFNINPPTISKLYHKYIYVRKYSVFRQRDIGITYGDMDSTIVKATGKYSFYDMCDDTVKELQK